LTSFLAEHDLDKVEDPMTAPPGNVTRTPTPGNITPTATPSNVNPAATPSNVIPTATPSNVNKVVQPQKATPSSVWPPDLIQILQRISATPCQQPTKPLFIFEPLIKAANKNFMLLKHKFSGDLQKALLAQQDSSLGYGLELNPIETLKAIFRNHPSWSRKKSVLSLGPKWPLKSLNEQDWIKDAKEALEFGNHKGAIRQQDHLKKLVTDDIIQGLLSRFLSAKPHISQKSSLLPSISKHRTPSTNMAKSFHRTN
jgi:hypothetical protein